MNHVTKFVSAVFLPFVYTLRSGVIARLSEQGLQEWINAFDVVLIAAFTGVAVWLWISVLAYVRDIGCRAVLLSIVLAGAITMTYSALMVSFLLVENQSWRSVLNNLTEFNSVVPFEMKWR